MPWLKSAASSDSNAFVEIIDLLPPPLIALNHSIIAAVLAEGKTIARVYVGTRQAWKHSKVVSRF